MHVNTWPEGPQFEFLKAYFYQSATCKLCLLVVLVSHEVKLLLLLLLEVVINIVISNFWTAVIEMRLRKLIPCQVVGALKAPLSSTRDGCEKELMVWVPKGHYTAYFASQAWVFVITMSHWNSQQRRFTIHLVFTRPSVLLVHYNHSCIYQWCSPVARFESSHFQVLTVQVQVTKD